MNNFPSKYGLLLGLVLMVLSSCNLERKIARQYIKSQNKTSVLLFTPSFIYKTNLKTRAIDDSVVYSQNQKDSILMASSLFLQNISDSLLLSNYINSYISNLKQYGIRLFTEDYVGEFMQDTGVSYVVNIAQLEIEEYVMQYKDQEYLDDQLYYAKHDLNALNFNAWYEIKKVNDETNQKEMLFTSQYISDDLYSQFTQYLFSNEIDYNYTIDSITTEHVLDFTLYLGRLHATYTFDYMMNQFISQKLPEGQSPAYYLHFNKTFNRLIPANDGRFETLE